MAELPVPEKLTLDLIGSILIPGSTSSKDRKVKNAQEMMKIMNQVTDVAKRYLTEKERDPDAFFLYGLADLLNSLILMIEVGAISTLDIQLGDVELDKNVEVNKTRDEFKKTLIELGKYTQRVRRIAISLPPGQLTRID